MKYVRYLWYVIRHKYYVGVECYKRGLYWRGTVHDLTKFFPDEFLSYAQFFYSGEQTPERKAAFRLAWLKHCNRNDHHWQYWTSLSDQDNKPRAQEMPEKARVEMLCDWIGMQRTLGKDNLPAWYAEREEFILLGPNTKRWLKQQLNDTSMATKNANSK